MATRKASVPRHLQMRVAQIHILTHLEMQRFLSVISDLRDKALFLVAYRHGLRASEIVQMKTTHVDLAGAKLLIKRISRGSPSHHPLQADEENALRKYLKDRADKSIWLFLGSRGSAVSRRGLDWLMKMYGAMAKLPPGKCHFHALKHSVAAHLLSAGVGVRILHDWLGHSAMQSTMVYVYLASPARDKKILRSLLGSLPV